jgi:catechol-2,3-dioxygenase
MTPALRFSHIGLFAHDLKKMEAFYAGTLGFFVTDRGVLETPRGPVPLVFLSRDPDEHHQIVLAGGRPETLSFNVVNQISLRAENLSALKAFWLRLNQAATPDLHSVTHGNALSVYFPDPEGNRIEVFIDTPWYVTQPMRVPLDFTLEEEALMHEAEQHARSLPGFVSRAEWRAKMVKLMQA